MMEAPAHDIDQGIDRLRDETESLVAAEFPGAAARLAEHIGSRDDDRAVVLLRRD